MKIYTKQGIPIYNGDVDDNSYMADAVMGDHNLTLYFSTTTHIEIPVGAYCDFQNVRFYLTRPENLKMKHSRDFAYTILMESDAAKAKIWKFRNPVDGRLKFFLTAKPKEHLQMIVDNLNRRESGWTVGECIDDTEHTISYDHNYIIEALAAQATEFKTEYEFKGKQVSLRKVEYNKNNPLPMSYGRGNGFISGVGRGNQNENPPVEILYVQGGEENIDPSKYGNNELLLPAEGEIAYDGDKFEDEEEFNATTTRHYIVSDDRLSIRRSDAGLDTLSEDSLDCSDIYPKRIGKVSEVICVDKDKNFYDFIDSSIPATLNFEDCLIEGEQLTIAFQTGMLAGREFEVKYYHDANSKTGKQGRRFEIVPAEIDGETMPNEIFKPEAPNDTYAVFKCNLPADYTNAYHQEGDAKTGAEWDMFRTAVKYKYENEDEKFTFSGTMDGIWAKKDWENIGGKIVLGGFVLFSDLRFMPQGAKVRITAYKQYINNPHSPEITLSNATITTGISSTLKELQAQEVVLDDYRKETIAYTKRRFRDAKETSTMLEELIAANYDTLSEQFTQGITPISIQTMQMLVGDESLQFRYVTSDVNPQTTGDGIAYDTEMKQLKAPARIIQHMTLGIGSISSNHSTDEYHFWSVAEYTSAQLDDTSKKYYLYAECQEDANTAVYKLSETPLNFHTGGKYNLLVGILNSEYEDARSFVTLYGYTEILPSRITTDKVISGDGDSFFDMQNNAMKLGEVLDFNTKGDGKMRLRGTLVQSQSGDVAPIGCYRGTYNNATTYFTGDEVSYTANSVTSTYRRTNPSSTELPTTGIPPTTTAYWQIIAQGANGADGKDGVNGTDGKDGEYTEYRFQSNGSKTTPPALSTIASEPSGWSLSTPATGLGWYTWATKARKNSLGALLETWCTPFRITPYDGTDGKDGENGKDGKTPAVIFRGNFDSSKTYYGMDSRLDCVKYGETYYITQITAGTFKGSDAYPTNTTKWNDFGASFDSVATNLLLAEGANIGDWFINSGKIVSTLESGNKIELDAKNKRILIHCEQGASEYEQTTQSNIDIKMDASRGVVEVNGNDGVSYMTPNGIFAKRAGMRCTAASTGFDWRASVAAIGMASLNAGINPDLQAIIGVYGESNNSGTAQSFGGYFQQLKAAGLILNSDIIESESTFYIDIDISLVLGFGTNKCDVYLPLNAQQGQVIYFKQWSSGYMRLRPRSGELLQDSSSQNDYSDIREGYAAMVMFTKASVNGDSKRVWLFSRWKL